MNSVFAQSWRGECVRSSCGHLSLIGEVPVAIDVSEFAQGHVVSQNQCGRFALARDIAEQN